MDPIVALNVVTKIYHAKARVVALDSINLGVGDARFAVGIERRQIVI